MRKIIIVGAGCVGGHIALNPELYGIDKNAIIAFIDDDTEKQGKEIFGYPVIGSVSWILDKVDYEVIIGIAFPSIKRKVLDSISINKQLTFPALVAKNAWVSNGSLIGKGTIIYPGCAINYGTKIGDFIVMNMNCSIGHNCVIGNYTSLAPGVHFAGYTIVDDLVDIGIGVSTKQNVKISYQSVIGGQSMIIHDIPPFSKVVGVPGRVINLK